MSQYRCLLCIMSMYTYIIALARKINIKYIAEGTRKSQLFAIEQQELLNEFPNYYNKDYGLPAFEKKLEEINKIN